MATIKLTIEYEGTAYAGWQRQPFDPTIQAALEEALFKITEQHIPTVGAGRTDSGVHALGQVVSFQSGKSLASTQWAAALNRYLPKDISVLSSEQVLDEFHARYSAKGKIYEYRITLQSSRPSLDRYRTWHFPYALDIDAMNQAMTKFIGTHDFTSFRGQRSQTRNPICTIFNFALSSTSTELIIRVEGNRFLKHMVRTLVGTLVEVGQHKRHASTMQDIITTKNRQSAGRTAPSHGLYLVQVLY